MLYVLVGQQIQAKQAFIADLLKKNPSSTKELIVIEDLLQSISQGDLFAPTKVIVCLGSTKAVIEQVDLLVASPHSVVILEDSLEAKDKTLQKIAARQNIVIKDFPILSGASLQVFIQDFITDKGARIADSAISMLVARLGLSRDAGDFDAFTRLSSEMDKLCTYAGKGEITEQVIQELVMETPHAAAFDIINAVAEKKRAEVIKLLDNFYASSSTDEKASTIQLGALLAEQLRGVALVLSAQQAGATEADILTKTGWKPGRLYMVKKVARGFAVKQVLKALAQLEYLDREMKSSTLSGRLLFDMVAAGLMS